ncbi:MAG: oligoendopeptidase F [Bacilli bacterium]|nr:oligoendopeptidase F [Bacilli bacterium]
MNREKIAKEYKWDLTKIYKTQKEFNQDYKEAEKRIKDFIKYENKMATNAKLFYQTLDEYFSITRLVEKLYVYTNLLFDEDTGNNIHQALNVKVNNLYNKLVKASYFITPTILKKDYSEIEKYYKEEPKLKEYEIVLEREYRYKEHTLSDIEEKLLSNISKMLNTNQETYELLKDSDLTFGQIHDENNNLVELTCSNYSVYIESKNREVRKEAFLTLYKTYKQFSNTFASTISGNINENITISRIKKYKSAIEFSLFPDEVNISIYNNLIKTVNNNLDILFKYYDLKKKLLNLDELHLYDIYTPIIQNYDKKYPFEEAKETVIKALSVLGDDYIDILKQGIKDRWIDVYPNKNKRTGGYSSGCYDTNPYILLNYQDKYNDMSTLAHELGHSMHSYYTRHNNPFQYGSYAIFVAEVASTVNELLLAKYLLKESNNKEEKLFILDNLMTLFKSTIYRQTMFAEFEKDIYNDAEKDIPLTADYLSEKYYKLNKTYFGKNVIVDEEVKYEWTRIPHFYYNFYVYKYATGLSAACHIVDDILSGKKNAIDNYKKFLSAGRTKTPLESLKLAGVDLSKKEVVESAIKMFNDTIEEFKSIYNE